MATSAPAAGSTPAAARREAGMEIVHLHAGMCAAADLIPIPLLGSVVVVGVQLQMVESLSRLYQVPFHRENSRLLLQAFGTGAVHAVVARESLSRSLNAWIRHLPLVGAPLRLLAWPALLAAFTYRLGKSYVEHFESGGRADDFKQEHLQPAQLVPLPL